MIKKVIFGLIAIIALLRITEGIFWRRRRCSARHCQWGGWSQWTSCTAVCGNSGTKTRHRGIAVHPDCGGSGCSGPSSQTVECNRFCYNGGTPQSTYCTCPDEYWGQCCGHRESQFLFYNFIFTHGRHIITLILFRTAEV